ncbi:MAG: ABC transporter ATP-binding protein [Pseudomonadota bacterium]
MPASSKAAAGPPAVNLRGVTKTFGVGLDAVEAVAETNILVEAGTTTALVGPSGCGKSTLLRMIAGLESPTGGEIRVGSEAPDGVSSSGELAVAFQDPSLLPWLTIEGNVKLAQRLARKPSDAAAIDALIERVGLSGFASRRPAELSGGMRQRAAIARCLATNPKVLLLDEPFGAVDELTRRRLNIELPPIWERGGATTVLVTHSVSEAVLLSDRVLVMSKRPGAIIHDISIPLARPRREEMIDSPEFRALQSKIVAYLLGEDRRPQHLKIAATG